MSPSNAKSALSSPSSAARNELVKAKELEKIVNLSRRTIGAYTASRKIPFIRLGARTVRFDPVAVLAALRKFEVKEVS